MNSGVNDQLRMAINLLQQVVDGVLDGEMAIEDWPFELNSKFQSLANAWMCLRHFVDDADLHEEDSNYLKSERERLLKCMSLVSRELGERERGERDGVNP